jgi:hypothetical protein
MLIDHAHDQAHHCALICYHGVTAHLLCGGLHAVMPLAYKWLLVALVLNCVFNEVALMHLWWAGSGHLPADAVRLLAVLYAMPQLAGFFGMRVLTIERTYTRRLSVIHWSPPSLDFWFNILAPLLIVFIAWGTAV